MQTTFTANYLGTQYYDGASRYSADEAYQGARWQSTKSRECVGLIGIDSLANVNWNSVDISNVVLSHGTKYSKYGTLRLYRSKHNAYDGNYAGTYWLDENGGYTDIEIGVTSQGTYDYTLSATNRAWLQTQLRLGYYWFCLYYAGETATEAAGRSAHWAGVESWAFTITYDTRQYPVNYNKGSNGSGTNVTDYKTHGTNLTLRGAIFTRAGYTQTGWAKSDGGAKVYNLGATYTTNAEVTLYPYWTINTYPVNYNGNGGGDNVTNVPATQTKTYGVSLTLSQTVPYRRFYTFVEWNTKADGAGTGYQPGESYNGNEAVTLYAQWKRASIVRMKVNGTIYTGTVHMKQNGTIYNGIAYTAKNGGIYIND